MKKGASCCAVALIAITALIGASSSLGAGSRSTAVNHARDANLKKVERTAAPRANDRKSFYGALVYQCAKVACVLRLHELGLGIDVDFCRSLADLKRGVDNHRLGDGQDVAFGGEGGEARSLDAEGKGAGIDAVEDISTRRSRFGRSRDIGCLIHECNRGAYDDRARFVLNCASHSRGGLREQQTCGPSELEKN